MALLDELYEWYELKSGCRPEKREAQKRFSEVWNRAERVLNEELGEELRNRMFEYMDEECSNDFQAGFRMGALLMLELQLPAIPTGAAPQGLSGL